MEGPNATRITRRKGACFNCRQRKTRCDGSPTCSQCMKSRLPCSYHSAPSVSGGKYSNSDAGQLISSSITRDNLYPSYVETPNRQKKAGHLDKTADNIQDAFVADFDMPSFVDFEIQDHIGSSFESFNLDPTGTDTIGLNKQLPNQAYEGGSHPLDHSVPTGPDPEWSRIWADDMCRDFSSLAPRHFLSRHVNCEELKEPMSNLSFRLGDKTNRVYKVPSSDEEFETSNAFEYSSLYEYGVAARYIDAFFSECYGYPPYVTRQQVQNAFADLVLSPDTVKPCSAALVNGILAIGCQALARQDCPVGVPQPADSKYSLMYFNLALRNLEAQSTGPADLSKLQALTTMIIYSRGSRDPCLTRSLLSQAIHLTQTLACKTPQSPTSGLKNSDIDFLQENFWLLYSIEKPFVMRFGCHSMIDDDLILFPSPATRNGTDVSSTIGHFEWRLVHHRYGRLCSLVVKTLYSHTALKKSRAQALMDVSNLDRMLETWRLSIPSDHRPQVLGQNTENRPGKRDTCIREDLHLKYTEAAFAIHRWSIILPLAIFPANDAAIYLKSQAFCVGLARDVLTLTCHIDCADVDSNWSRLYMPLLSATIIFIAIAKSAGCKEDLAYLGIACGYFGTLGTRPTPGGIDLFEEINNLSVVAYRLLHEEQYARSNVARCTLNGRPASVHNNGDFQGRNGGTDINLPGNRHNSGRTFRDWLSPHMEYAPPVSFPDELSNTFQ